MEKKPLPELDRICAAFDCAGTWLSSCPIPSGHINDTYCSEFDESGRRVKYVNQRINHLVFREPEQLMENIERVTRFARERITAAGGDPDRETLTIVPTRDGKSFHRTPEGTYWRTFRYIDGARTYDKVEDLRHVYSAAKAFGNFQKMLARLPGPAASGPRSTSSWPGRRTRASSSTAWPRASSPSGSPTTTPSSTTS
jgi:hypothetical protein